MTGWDFQFRGHAFRFDIDVHWLTLILLHAILICSSCSIVSKRESVRIPEPVVLKLITDWCSAVRTLCLQFISTLCFLIQHVDFTKFIVITAFYNISQQVMGSVRGSYIV